MTNIKVRTKKYKIADDVTDALTETLQMTEFGKGKLYFENIPLSKIYLDEENPRQLHLTKEDIINGLQSTDLLYEIKQKEIEDLRSLAHSIQNNDLLNPIVVYESSNGFKVVAGERRTLGSLLAKKEYITAKILDKKPEPDKIAILQWIENLERRDLNLWEKINNLHKIIRHSNIEISGVKLSQVLSCSKTQAQAYATLLNNLNPKIEELIKNGIINNLDKAVLISKLPENEIEDFLKNAEAQDKYQTLTKLRKATSKNTTKRGRKAKLISIGKTKNLLVAKIFFDSLKTNTKLTEVMGMVDEPNWRDIVDINNYFADLINLIERTI